ncbi:CHAT domain-containing protein [Nostoc punctiforme]|uniref:WD-40 repeat protein n=1 Tax=Nostoc punctiforme (strain ATCC 29133 / PCC 73102) TaxID=63737 RepID=B2JAS8_NOSP7|nr:CHAT domain-containing protein [Nostoc punctiforme]ACC85032.1 WD-40 repeat protein [Nostoc punctiforme PCC 73102]
MTFTKFACGCILLLISACLFIPNRQLIVTASTIFKDIAQASGASKYSPIELNPYASTVENASFSPDGRFIITGFDNGTARIWDKSGNLITELKAGENKVKSAFFSPNSKFIVTSSNRTKIWDTSGKKLVELKGYNPSISPDCKFIVTTFLGATLWDTSGKLLVEFKEDKDNPVMSASFSPDSKLIITALRNGIVRVWDTNGKLITEFTADRNLLKSAVFSPNGKLIFTTSFGTSRVWDILGKLLAELKGRHLSIQSANFSPDSKLIVTTSLNNSDFFNRNAQVWDTSGKEIAELKGHEGDVTGANFSPDGKRIVTVSNDGTARIWDTNGKMLLTLKGHQGNVSKASFSPDGQLVITASDDGTSRLWDANAKQLATLNLGEKIAISPKAEADRLRDLQFYSPNCALAFDPWQKALKLYQQISDKENQAVILEKLGNAHYCIGYYTSAIQSYTQATAIAQKFNYPQLQANNLSNLGNVYNTLADYETAINKYNEALKLLPKDNSPSKAKILQGRGNSYNSQSKYREAIQDYLQALAIDEVIKNTSGVAENKVNLASIYLASGDTNKATQYYKEALDIKPMEALSGLGNVYWTLGEINKAIDLYQQSLAKAQQQENKEGEGNALNSLGFTLYKSDRLTEAEQYLRPAIAIWENLRIVLDDGNKISIFEKQTRTYRLLQEVLIAQNKITEALEVSESGRARAFIELLSKRLSPNQTEQLKVPVLNTEQMKQVAKNENATLVQYSIITDEFKVGGKLQTQDSELYIWVIKPTGEIKFYPIDLKPLWQQQNTSLRNKVDQTRQSIVKDVSLTSRSNNITLTPGDRVKLNDDEPDWEAWQVVSVDIKNGKITIRLPSWEAEKPAIERPIIDVVKKIGINSFVANAKNLQLQELYQLLIQPIADILPKEETARVIFIPQDALFLVPFPALQDSSGQYLIDKHTILTAPSIQILESTHKLRQKVPGSAKDILIVGNPTMPKVSKNPRESPQQLGALPGSEKEALAIASFWKTQALIGNQATKKAVLQKLPLAKIIHLATHGLLDDIRGLGSSIVFAPEGQDNGLLTAEDILKLYTALQGSTLSAELVVLSACDTGQGRLTGDGVIGLSRSIIAAGVPSVIVSLWSIPDAPTAELMTEFYENFRKNPDKATALRQAMLTTKKKHPNPVEWAAFTLIGESE